MLIKSLLNPIRSERSYFTDPKRVARVLLQILTAVMLGSGLTVSAAIVTWFGYDQDDSRWEYAANWDGGVVPGAADEVQILYDPGWTPGLNPDVVLSEPGVTTVDVLRLLGGGPGTDAPTLTVGQHAQLLINDELQMQNATLYLQGGIQACAVELVVNSVIDVNGTIGAQGIQVESSLFGEGSILMNGSFLVLEGAFMHTGGTWLNSGRTNLESDSLVAGADGEDAALFSQGEAGEDGQVGVNLFSDLTGGNTEETMLHLQDFSSQVWGGLGGDGSDHDSGDGGRGGDGGSAIVVTAHGAVVGGGGILGGLGGYGGEGEVNGGVGGAGGHGLEFLDDGRYHGDGMILGGSGGWGGDAVHGQGGDGGDGGDAIVFRQAATASLQQDVLIQSSGLVIGGMSGLGGISESWSYSLPDWDTWLPTLTAGNPLVDENDFSSWDGGLLPHWGASGQGGVGIRYVQRTSITSNEGLIAGGWAFLGGQAGAAIAGGSDGRIENVDGLILGGYALVFGTAAPAIDLVGNSNWITNKGGGIYGGDSLIGGTAAPAIRIVGNSNFIRNQGTIYGGTSWRVLLPDQLANAIEITGDENMLMMDRNSRILGNVVVSGTMNTLYFDHDDPIQDWVFDSSVLRNQLEPGRHDLYVGFDGFAKIGEGELVMRGATDTAANWGLNAGTLRTEGKDVLGRASLFLFWDSTLEVVGPLHLNSLTTETSDSRIRMRSDPYTEERPHILLDAHLQKTNPGDSLHFVLNTYDYQPNTPYSLIGFSSTNLTAQDIQGNVLYGLAPQFYFSDSGDALYVIYTGGATEGPRIQNSGPYFTPVTADFIVTEAAQTGSQTENNTINSLNFQPGTSLQIYNTLNLTSGILNVQGGTVTIQGGTLNSPGIFNKTGNGTLILSSVTYSSSQVSILEGGMIVNSSIYTPGNLVIYHGAFLGGDGIIHGDVINHGIISPGNSPGTLTVAGNFVQSGSGVLAMELASSTWYDRLVVTGNARLGGTLRLIPLGGYFPEYGQKLGILHAGSFTGQFDRIEVPGPYRGRFLTSSVGEGEVLFAPDSYTRVAQTENQFAVASALDEFIPAQGDDREVVSTALDHLRAEEYPYAFEQIQPGLHVGTANLLIEQASSANRMLGRRLSLVRYLNRLQPVETLHDPQAPETVDSAPSNQPQKEWNAWLEGTGIFAEVKQPGQLENHRHDTGGFFGGADYRLDSNAVLGLFAGYQTTRARYDGGGRNTVDGVILGGYATWQAEQGFYVEATLSGGVGKQKTRRPIAFSSIERNARADGDHYQFNGALTLGQEWQAEAFTFGISLTGEYSRSAVQSFTEYGADSLNLSLSHQGANSFRTRLGGTVHYDWQVSERVTLRPGIHAYWQHELANDARDIRSALDEGRGVEFITRTHKPSRDSVQAGAGVSAIFREGWSAQLYYNLDIGRGDYTAHQVSLGVNKRF